ncbi:hypothetical protein E0L13_10865 [Megasphaera sp. SW808]|uniref:hypothetical protein n=1 Tax=Megasphaera sp. SW808 TaxID=2530045 RepID=UPI00143A4664|nr:hypothetical protein [Megasphaera sp. SW808]NJE35516.1 hypothetical protein [Megasphaera sp. SW808]
MDMDNKKNETNHEKAKKQTVEKETLQIDPQKMELAEKVLTKLFKIIKIPLPRRDLAEIAQMYSKQVDTLIFKVEQSKGYTYIGGEFAIIYLGKDKFKLNISLYFKDNDNDWVKASSNSEPSELKYLTDTAIMELKEKKQVKFDIDTPKR